MDTLDGKTNTRQEKEGFYTPVPCLYIPVGLLGSMSKYTITHLQAEDSKLRTWTQQNGTQFIF